jgi:hypothetical protein
MRCSKFWYATGLAGDELLIGSSKILRRIMMMKKWTSSWLVALGCFAVLSLAIAAEPAPSGTVTMTSKAVAIGIGVSWGDGTLTFDGKTYPFSVDGLSVADLGVSNISTSGEVFNLKNVADFSGNYASGEAGIAIAGGPTDTIMKNQNGVVLRLHGTQQGARLTLAAGGVKLTIK